MNQVYFYSSICSHDAESSTAGLNPFMNQVYFYSSDSGKGRRWRSRVLIPL